MLARWLGAAVAAPCLVLLSLLSGSLLVSGGHPRAASSDRLAGTRATRQAAHTAPPESVVANVKGTEVAVYRAPGARRVWRRYSNPTPQRTPLVFLVSAARGAWLRVMLPSRPNGSQGWIRAGVAELRVDPYSLLVDLRERELVVRYRDRSVLTAPVGVGRAATPTPSGLYYLAELLRQPDPAGLYGPWAFALSAHSRVLSHFGGGDGQIGLHGTDEPWGVGHTVSHGCIRVRDGVIERLARLLPLGTPVRIVADGGPRREFTRT
jgi:lipoprotein-anchoring transpeptidase ErfK/SrfK